MIKMDNISKKFKEIVLFENESIDFPEGKKIMIKGINGSGKSVLLKLIVGYSLPDTGTIIIDEKVLGKDCDFIPNAGVSINAPEFCDHLSGIENLMELSKIRNIANEKDIYDLAKKLDFDIYLKKKYKNYSLGMKQKMRIIQALMDKPKYLILDEPFDALDQKSQIQVTKMLNDYIKKDKTLIFTSHNGAYEKIADCIYEILDTKIIKK